jgi:hypothetical protein
VFLPQIRREIGGLKAKPLTMDEHGRRTPGAPEGELTPSRAGHCAMQGDKTSLLNQSPDRSRPRRDRCEGSDGTAAEERGVGEVSAAPARLRAREDG